MKEELKTAWVSALRSGEYAQTRGRLHRPASAVGRPAGYCCLGVLCEVAASQGLVKVETLTDGSRKYHTGRPAEPWCDTMPGTEIEEALEIYGHVCSDLAAKNDGEDGEDPWSFTQIADWIESHL